MAYKRNRKRSRNTYRGRSSYSRRSGGSGSNGGSGVYMPGNEFIAGVVAGWTDIADKHLPGELVVAAAVAPIKGMSKVTNFAKGVVFGNILQARFGKSVSTGKSVNQGGMY